MSPSDGRSIDTLLQSVSGDFPPDEWLIQRGALAELIRSTDWSSTPLGPRQHWPQWLQTVLAVLLESRFPMALLWGPELLLLYNDAYLQVAADKHPRALGRPMREVWPEVWHINEPLFASVMDSGETVYIEDQPATVNRKGFPEETYFTLCCSPVRGDHRRICATLVTLQETTSQVIQRQRLAASYEYVLKEYSHAAELLDFGDAFFELDANWRILRVNANQEKLSRTPRSQSLGQILWEKWPELARTDGQYWSQYHRCMQERVPVQFDEYYAPLDMWTGVTAYPTSSGGIAVFFRNITEQKRAERAALANEAKYRALFNSMTEGFSLGEITYDQAGQPEDVSIVEANPAFARQTGTQAAALLGHSLSELWDDSEHNWKEYGRTLAQTGEPIQYQTQPNALGRSFEVRAFLTEPGFIGVLCFDITDLKTIERSLLSSNEQLREANRRNIEYTQQLAAVYDHLPHAVLVWQKQAESFGLARLNKAAQRTMNLQQSSVLQHSPEQLARELPFPNLAADLQECYRERSVIRRELECRLPHEKAHRQFLLTYGFVPPDMVLAHAEDVTEQRQAEEHLRLAQRLEAIGRLAGGVAHDFNNMLSVILSYTDFTLESCALDAPIAEDLRQVHRAAERAATLTRQLLAFGRKQILEPRVIDLNNVVSNMQGMLRPLLGEDIEIRVDLAPHLGKVYADPAQIEQVVMNLAVNSRDAMPEGGMLTIETANVELDAEYVNAHFDSVPGAYVLLSVTDTGQGMDEKTRTRLFEPFFTTKALGKGTGLGLATVYGIVKQSGGNIWVYSELGKGTTFKVYFPRELEKAQELAPATAPSLANPKANKTVLVVEDEAPVRMLAARMLRREGYIVLEASGTAEALELSQKHSETIHLLLTDVVMQRGSGKELAQRLQQLRPEVRVLYMSGYSENAIVHHGVLDSGINFISKPFSAADLTRKVREVLGD